MYFDGSFTLNGAEGGVLLILSVFFAPVRYMVVKIMRSCSEVVLRTTKHTMVYPGSCPSLEVIALRSVV
jgi:hypothetical protein